MNIAKFKAALILVPLALGVVWLCGLAVSSILVSTGVAFFQGFSGIEIPSNKSQSVQVVPATATPWSTATLYPTHTPYPTYTAAHFEPLNSTFTVEPLFSPTTEIILPAAPTITLTPECNIKGNVNGSEKIYHVLGQRDYDEVQIKPEEGDQWFCTEKEAGDAGFRPAMQ